MLADTIKIHPVENEDTIIRCWKAGAITRETAFHKLWNLPLMTFEHLLEITGNKPEKITTRVMSLDEDICVDCGQNEKANGMDICATCDRGGDPNEDGEDR